MIVDAHTHIFPSSFVEERDRLCRVEPVFGELYGSPRARMATAEELLSTIDASGVDRAVVAGFAWADSGRCIEHNEALLEAVDRSGGRLTALCCVPASDAAAAVREMRRCMVAGAVGFGELRLGAIEGGSGNAALLEPIGREAQALGAVLMLHASEPVGHDYAGKSGGALADIWRFLATDAGGSVVLAHLGGGLPFFAHMPEVRSLFERVYVDTAAAPWLYAPAAVRATIDLIGRERVLFGSDFPLRHPARDLQWLRDALPDEQDRAAVLGENAARLFGRGGAA